jgi:PAS domain S-box-containing protein
MANPDWRVRQSEERFRLLLRSVTDYMLDPDGHVTSWNAGVERFKGYKADEIIGQHFSLLRPGGLPASGRRRCKRHGMKAASRLLGQPLTSPMVD